MLLPPKKVTPQITAQITATITTPQIFAFLYTCRSLFDAIPNPFSKLLSDVHVKSRRPVL
jgi:hypothetical protein